MADQQNKKTITLVEHQKLFRQGAPGAREKNSLPGKEFIRFKDSLLDNSDENKKPPFLIRGDHLKAINYVGAIITQEGTRIEVFPKIDFLKGSTNEIDQGQSEETDEESSQKEITEPEKKERVRILLEMLHPYLGRHHREFDKGSWGDEELPFLEGLHSGLP